MRPRNCLAYRLALPLAIVVSSAPRADAGPIVTQIVAPAAGSPGLSVPKTKPERKGAWTPRRNRAGSVLPSSPPPDRSPSHKDDVRASTGLVDPSLPRATDEGSEVRDVSPPDPATSSAQGLSPGGSPLLLLPLPPNAEPGETRTYAGETGDLTDAVAREVASPSGANDAVTPPRSPDEVSTPQIALPASPLNSPAASTPVSHTPDRLEVNPDASAISTDRGSGNLAPVVRVPQGADAKALPGATGTVISSPNAANSPLGSPSGGSATRDSGVAAPASAETDGVTSGLAGSGLPQRDPAGAKPVGIATAAQARSTGMPSDSQTTVVANVPGQGSSRSGDSIGEAAQGSSGTTSLETATAFGQMITAAVIAQQLSTPGLSGGVGSQAESSTDKSPLAMSDRALLAEVGGTTPLDPNPVASSNVAGAAPIVPVADTRTPSAPSVPYVPDLPLPAVEAGEGPWRVPAPATTTNTPLNPSVSPVPIPEPTPLVQLVVVIIGSALIVARRQLPS